MRERRQQARTAFSGQAYLTFDGRCRCETVVDVSPDGLQLRSDVRLRIGATVKVFLPLPGSDDGATLSLLKGRVVRRTRGLEGSGLGIEFEPGALDTRSLLHAHLRRM